MGGRKFTRVSYLTGASIRYGNEVAACKTDNVSLRGMYLQADLDIPANATVNVTVYHSNQSSFKINASVVRKEENGVALQITNLDTGSFARLRDIVSNNSDDPGKVMKETFGMLKCIY
jgi:hypothetical protein